jgi:hypothetical protein
MADADKTTRSALWLALVGIAGAMAGALVTGAFNHFDHASDIDAKMIELSISILSANPTPETKPLREWAIDVIQKRAKFNFDEEQIAILKVESLPRFVITTGGPSGPVITRDLTPADRAKMLELWSKPLGHPEAPPETKPWDPQKH